MDKFTVRDANGLVDVAASAVAYATALQAWVVENEADSQRLTDLVNKVFEQFAGKTLPVPAVVALVVHELGSSPADHKAMTARVHKHVQTMASTTGPLVITKGKNGGIRRKPVEDAVPVAE